MAEPAATTTAGIAIGLGTVTITGSIFGVQWDALLAGFLGGLISLSVLPPMTRWRVAVSVAVSAILAGYFAPIAAAWALAEYPWMATVGDLARLASAVAIGIGWQSLLPFVLEKFRSLIADGIERLRGMLTAGGGARK